MFAKKEGQWDCSLCSVRNEANAVKCVACQNPVKPSSSTTVTALPSFKFGTSEMTKPPRSGFEGMFARRKDNGIAACVLSEMKQVLLNVLLVRIQISRISLHLLYQLLPLQRQANLQSVVLKACLPERKESGSVLFVLYKMRALP